MKTKNSVLRWFGLIWVLVLTVLIPLLKPEFYDWGDPVSYSIAGVMLLSTLFYPIGLKPLFIVQTKIATLIGNVVSVVILFLLFYLIIFPIGLILRVSGKDLLRKRMGKLDSYWIIRDKQPNSLTNQF